MSEVGKKISQSISFTEFLKVGSFPTLLALMPSQRRGPLLVVQVSAIVFLLMLGSIFGLCLFPIRTDAAKGYLLTFNVKILFIIVGTNICIGLLFAFARSVLFLIPRVYLIRQYVPPDQRTPKMRLSIISTTGIWVIGERAHTVSNALIGWLLSGRACIIVNSILSIIPFGFFLFYVAMSSSNNYLGFNMIENSHLLMTIARIYFFWLGWGQFAPMVVILSVVHNKVVANLRQYLTNANRIDKELISPELHTNLSRMILLLRLAIILLIFFMTSVEFTYPIIAGIDSMKKDTNRILLIVFQASLAAIGYPA